MPRKTSKATQELHEKVVDAYQGIETRELSMVRHGDTFTRRMTLRIFRWKDGAVTKEGNAAAFAAFLGVEISTVHAIVKHYEGPMRDGTKGKGKGSNPGVPVIREDIVDTDE